MSLNWGLVDARLAAGLSLGSVSAADEFFKEYDAERTDVQLFTAQLVTPVALHVLPSYSASCVDRDACVFFPGECDDFSPASHPTIPRRNGGALAMNR